MFQPEIIWNYLQIFIQNHSHFSLLLLSSLLISIPLSWWQPKDQKLVVVPLSVLAISLVGVVISDALSALDMPNSTTGLHRVSTFACGAVFIRLLSLLCFKLLIPLFRQNVLRFLEVLTETAAYYAWLMVYLFYIGIDVSGILITSAILTAGLAFAMQLSMGNIFGGFALQFEKLIKIGDWINVDDVNGRVTDIQWRYTSIETRNWETVVIPNNVLLNSKFSVIGRRDGKPVQWRRLVYFETGFEHSTGQIIKIAENAIRNGHVANVASNPPANCLLVDFNLHSARYVMRYWLIDIEADETTDSEVHNRISVALLRAGIKMPHPFYNSHLPKVDEKNELNKKIRSMDERIDALCSVNLFNNVYYEELVELAEKLTCTPFAKGDVIARHGTVAPWLFIIISGSADIFLKSHDGVRQRIDTIHDGGLLGELGLMTGEARPATIIAQTEILAYRLDKEAF